MKRSGLCIAAFAALSLSAGAASAQGTVGLDKLYILNCGEGVPANLALVAGRERRHGDACFDNCYLIKHAQGWFLWDTGVADAVAAMPDGLAPPDPRMTHWRRPKTLAAQLDQLGVKPADIKYVAVSHTHRTTSATSNCSRRPCCWCRRPNTSGRARTARGSSRSIR